MSFPTTKTVTLESVMNCKPLLFLSDIKFTFSNEGAGPGKEVHANKFVLAAINNVFEKQFFWMLKEKSSVDINDASHTAFSLFLDIIIGKDVVWRNIPLNLLCEIYYLSKKYLVTNLDIKVVEEVERYLVTIDTLIYAGTLMEKYSHINILAEAIMKAATRFIGRFIKEHKCIELHPILKKICQFTSYMGAVKYQDVEINGLSLNFNIIDAIYYIEVTEETLLETAHLAETYSHMGDLSTALFAICVEFLVQLSTTERLNIFKLIPVGPDTSIILHKLINCLAEEQMFNCSTV